MTDKYLYSVNGIISRTVASNHLTVAIKNFDGTDFSAGSPLVHKIGGIPRTLTGALSVTVNAGANTFNAGSNELKTLEQDYFTYLGYRASDTSIFILISRIPYAKTYGEFSTTATNEKYGAYSGAAPASTDPVVNIGRFNATNSGSASYNWSVPATSIVINYPIFETRALSWTPQWTNLTVGTGTVTATYKVINRRAYCVVGIVWGNTTSISGAVDVTFPITRLQTDTTYLGTVLLQDTGTINYSGVCRFISASVLRIYVSNNSGTYETLTNLSSTVPHTWTTTDVIATEYQYDI